MALKGQAEELDSTVAGLHLAHVDEIGHKRKLRSPGRFRQDLPDFRNGGKIALVHAVFPVVKKADLDNVDICLYEVFDRLPYDFFAEEALIQVSAVAQSAVEKLYLFQQDQPSFCFSERICFISTLTFSRSLGVSTESELLSTRV